MGVTSETAIPRLRTVTRPLDGTPDLLSLADPTEPLVWNRGDRGCVGIGEAVRLTFRGADRFQESAAAWRAIASAAEIDDPVRLPGSGLVALGAFAFDDESSAGSVIIVPRLLVARHRDSWWITETIVQGQDPASDTSAFSDAERVASDAIPRAAQSGPWPGVNFSPAALTLEPTPTSGHETTDSVAAYLTGVRESVSRIAAGAAEKIVLARQIEGALPASADLRVPLRRLADGYLDCWTFAVDGIVGASPETLIRSTGGAVSARVLAGTRARHADDQLRDARARDELLTSAKEQHEHAFAVQSVVTALSPHVRGLRTSEEPFPLRLPNVWHLATDLGASLDERSSAIELVGALHPTAAVAGTPTAAAVAVIAELEPFDRGRYSGAVGWIDAAGDGEWVIALRCAQLGPINPATGERSVTASAGGGIVAGSDPEHEFGETVSKFRPITEAFAREI